MFWQYDANTRYHVLLARRRSVSAREVMVVSNLRVG
jgi:hypothetical protein